MPSEDVAWQVVLLVLPHLAPRHVQHRNGDAQSSTQRDDLRDPYKEQAKDYEDNLQK